MTDNAAARKSAEGVASAVEQFEDSADRRTVLAADRTIFAAERTYAACGHVVQGMVWVARARGWRREREIECVRSGAPRLRKGA